MENRRGFLKTLGKLGAALGITTAACSSSHHRGHHYPKHPKHPKHPTHPTRKATIGTAPKAKIKTPSHSELKTFGGIVPRPKGTFEFGFTGFKTDPLAQDKIDQLQRDANLLYNSVIDAKHLGIDPPMVVPPHVYDYITKRHVMDNLDPYQWGNVFDLKWVDWHSTDARFATKRGYWEARVKRPYRGIFKEAVYRQKVELPMEYLVTRVDDINPIKEHAKRGAYEELVNALRTAITVVIATDKKMNPKAPKADNKQSSFDRLSATARESITK